VQHIGVLFGILFLLLLISAFFSSAETSLLSFNRYRLRHLVRKKNRKAILVDKLLQRPDRLLSVILVGNTFANTLAPAVVTLIAVDLMGEMGAAIGPLILTFVILIFSEIAPKTVAALHPQAVSFFVARPLTIINTLLLPIVFLANYAANSLLRLFGLEIGRRQADYMSSEELRAIVHETGNLIPHEHKEMLLSILDLEKITVNDIMIQRSDIMGLDLSEPWEIVLKNIEDSHHTRMPLYHETMDDILGFIHIRDVMRFVSEKNLTPKTLQQAAEECLFVPAGTALHTQLLNFKKLKKPNALVVDEYGEVLGLVTLEDLLEEIVGEFATERSALTREIYPQEDSSFLVDGSASIRDLNRIMGWHLPTRGPKTLSGLIIEHLEFIPTQGTCLKIAGYPIEVIQIKDNRIKMARISPLIRQKM
jgi:Mg2+/Co2+ transporter CorB